MESPEFFLQTNNTGTEVSWILTHKTDLGEPIKNVLSVWVRMTGTQCSTKNLRSRVQERGQRRSVVESRNSVLGNADSGGAEVPYVAQDIDERVHEWTGAVGCAF